ncbi:MAG TPA: hypothetical protein VI731_02230, partial [Bacteroidia bacterium]|nr:hypothetical protein [Bacteroidia bacterium]
MKLSVITEAPSWYILLCIFAGALYAGVLYWREKKLVDISRWLLGIMATFRFIVVFILAFLLLSPLLETVFRDVHKPVIVVAQDVSESLLMGKDSAFNRHQYSEKLQLLVDGLEDKYEVFVYSFGDHFRQGLDFNYPDKYTDFSTLFDEISTRYSDRNLGAVIVASDGIYNQGQSPVYAAAKIRAPVFSVAMGDTTIRKDLILSKVVHNRIAFLGNTFPLEAVIDAHRCAGSRAMLSVSKGKQTLVSKPVEISKDPFTVTIPVELQANAVGLQRYSVALTVLEGESNAVNNRQDIFIDVLDAREKILIVGASPHPDIGAIKLAIETNDNYQVETYMLDKFNEPVQGFSMAILHGIPSETAQGKKLLADLAAGNIPVFYVTGHQNRYGLFNNLATGVSVSTSGYRANEVEPYAVADFPLFNLSETTLNYISKFPAVICPFGNFQVSPAAIPLLRQKIGLSRTDYPLWIFSTQDERKVSVFLGEGLFKWRLH